MRRVLTATAGLILACTLLPSCSGEPSSSGRPQQTPATTRTATAAGTAVSFPAADGAPLTGRLFGHGTTAVVLSNMGDNSPAAWERFAPVLADRGYLVLSYSYRYPAPAARFTRGMAAETLQDLAGAVSFVREQGAREVVLVGASLGGMATAGLAGSGGVRAAIVLSAPAQIEDVGYRVDRAALAGIAVPVLYVGADNDPIVPLAATRELYELTGGPRRWQAYPERAHGVGLFDTASGPALTRLVIDFLAGTAPAGR